MNLPLLIQSLTAELHQLQAQVKQLSDENQQLKKELSVYQNKKDSSNSHTPPSQDPHRPQKNQSLRESSGKKPGGQPGHPGTTLPCSAIPDEVITHKACNCNHCGSDLSHLPHVLIETRQVIDLPVIQPICTEHQIYQTTCPCGHTEQSTFPPHVTAAVQYGPRIEALTGYLHTRQYMPFKRTQEFFAQVTNLPISTGSICNMVQRLADKALPHYHHIKEQIMQATVVGTDETSARVNGKKNWFWTWQNEQLTFIVCSDNRGGKTIEDTFAHGLPHAILNHDRLAAHFNCTAQGHQICTAHLLRDLKYITQMHPDCRWTPQIKQLLTEAIDLKKQMTTADYYQPHPQRSQLSQQLQHLLQHPPDEQHEKAYTLFKSLHKHKDYILLFLDHPQVPPDNNGSERAIRNLKVKQKVSTQFKSDQGANNFAILRSIVDTAIKILKTSYIN